MEKTAYEYTEFPNSQTRASRPLRFMENYISRIDSVDYSGSYLPYYAPDAIIYDTTGEIYRGGEVIWTWIHSLFSPLSKIRMDVKHTLVVPDGGDRFRVYMDTVANFWLKANDELVSVDRYVIFTLDKATAPEGSQAEQVGFEDLQVKELKLFWDRTKLLEALRRASA